MNLINSLVDEYYDWLKERTIIKTGINDWTVIDTPFFGLFNDSIVLYAKLSGENIVMSDDGQTFNNLSLAGVDLLSAKSKKRISIAEEILLNYGIENSNGELNVIATDRDFKQKKHNFISAILALTEMQLLASSNVSTMFKEDVRAYLEDNEITFTPEFISKGSATNLEFIFDFQIAGKTTETVIKSFGMVTKPLLTNFLFSWEDIKPTREKISRKTVNAMAIINDDKNLKEDYINALKSKGSDIILWSERNKLDNINKLKKVA
jgi:galactitol-specific phosphotransferase system IIB component